MKSIIAAAQMTSADDIDHNFDICNALVAEASLRGAALISLPENFAYLPEDSTRTRQIAEPLDGPLMSRYRALAKQHGIWMSLGGFIERDSDQFFNTHVVVNKQGEITVRYRKIHLFIIDMPNNPSLDESKVISAGRDLICTDSPVGKLGLSICYDLRFSEQYAALTKMGAQILLVPSAFTATTGKAHWEILLRARAIENQSYVVAAAQVGVHNPKRHTHGHAMIVDPWGCVIAQCGDSMGIACAEIDLDYIAQVRSRIPMKR